MSFFSCLISVGSLLRVSRLGSSRDLHLRDKRRGSPQCLYSDSVTVKGSLRVGPEPQVSKTTSSKFMTGVPTGEQGSGRSLS